MLGFRYLDQVFKREGTRTFPCVSGETTLSTTATCEMGLGMPMSPNLHRWSSSKALMLISSNAIHLTVLVVLEFLSG